MAYDFKWSATFLNCHVSPLSVRGTIDHATKAELASKLAWAIGTTLELPYKANSTIRDDCRYLADFLVANLSE